MKLPIRALRVTSGRGSCQTHGEIEIPPTRGNAQLLAKIAQRSTTLAGVLRNYGVQSMYAQNAASGALILSRTPLSGFPLHEVAFDLSAGRWSPRVTLTSADGARLILNHDGSWHLNDWMELAGAADIPVDAGCGEVTCPRCQATNTRIALAARPAMGCFECGHPSHAVLQRATKEAA